MTKIKLTLKKFIIKKKLKETSHLICANKYEKKHIIKIKEKRN